jgi:hypothetical protein
MASYGTQIGFFAGKKAARHPFMPTNATQAAASLNGCTPPL